MHLLAAVLLLFPVFNSMANKPAKGPDDRFFGKLIFPGMPTVKVAENKTPPTGGGTGGARESDPARHGGLPLFDWLQKTPPAIVRNPQPKLPAETTLVGPPEILVSPTELLGDPFSKAQTNSQGPGAGNGFGGGCCGGAGPGNGRGSGFGGEWGIGDAGRPQRPGRNGVGYPECTYCPTPSFSEEARKAKLQGGVTLHIVVGTDGRVTNIRVERGLGMGLDERAIEAVRSWRLKPALGPGGKPVPTEVLIEVTFRLL
ncbi:MAG: energy transducer TonB [Acidobacteria bacterium]|nr:energy transducer TonB [Acidobacteriota bacterium]